MQGPKAAPERKSSREREMREMPEARIKSVPADPAAALREEIERLKLRLQEMEARAELLEQSAQEDALTGLLNRRGFEAAFARTASYLQRYGGTAALFYLDLDRFKPVNDRFGHAAGDVVLQQIAGLLKGSVRGSDLAARIGGDEFALLLLHIDAVQADKKARALADLVGSSSFEVANQKLDVGVSIGVAMLTGGETLEGIMQRADAAMYATKKERRG